MPDTSKIIVKNLTEQIIREAIQAYAENDGYWLNLCQFRNNIDISVLNKNQAAQKDVNNLIKHLALRNDNTEIGNGLVKSIKNISKARRRRIMFCFTNIKTHN